MVLMNYIQLQAGVPTRMHFSDDYVIERTILERESGKEKIVTSLVFWCDELNGEPAARTFSILSQKLRAHFEPYRKGKKYADYDFIVTGMGSGWYSDWNVQPILRPKTE
ncbi:MAG: hypothetical protein A2Y89_06760 [Chloroflexi bacterium RBG_13_51_18]|nr:MAG: hypothetical protein A2Y89_06760 [Chloroflexi bacterium RBG_13_51_18]